VACGLGRKLRGLGLQVMPHDDFRRAYAEELKGPGRGQIGAVNDQHAGLGLNLLLGLGYWLAE